MEGLSRIRWKVLSRFIKRRRHISTKNLKTKNTTTPPRIKRICICSYGCMIYSDPAQSYLYAISMERSCFPWEGRIKEDIVCVVWINPEETPQWFLRGGTRVFKFTFKKSVSQIRRDNLNTFKICGFPFVNRFNHYVPKWRSFFRIINIPLSIRVIEGNFVYSLD